MISDDPLVNADTRHHIETYRGFVRGMKLAIAHSAFILLLLAWFLV